MTVAGGRAFTPAWPLREASPGQLCPRLTELPPLLPACSNIPGTAFSMWDFSLQIHFFWDLSGRENSFLHSCVLSGELRQSKTRALSQEGEKRVLGLKLLYSNPAPQSACLALLSLMPTGVAEEPVFPLLLSSPPPSGAPPFPLGHLTPPPPSKDLRLGTVPLFSLPKNGPPTHPGRTLE